MPPLWSTLSHLSDWQTEVWRSSKVPGGPRLCLITLIRQYPSWHRCSMHECTYAQLQSTKQTETSLISQFSCLLKLPPSNLEWPTSFSGLFLPSMYGGWFHISQGKLWSIWIYIYPCLIGHIHVLNISPHWVKLSLAVDDFICDLSLPVPCSSLIFSV